MPQAQAQTVNPFLTLLPQIVIIFVIFYFILILPQRKKEKDHQKMLNNLARNDEIVTNSGIHGTIVNVKERTIILRIDENVKIELDKNCIAYKKQQQTKEG